MSHNIYHPDPSVQNDAWIYLSTSWTLARLGYVFDADAPPIIDRLYREHPERRALLIPWVLHIPHPSFWREYTRLLHQPEHQAEALGALEAWAAFDSELPPQVSELVWRQASHTDPFIAFAASLACASLLHGGDAAWHQAASVLKGWRQNQPEPEAEVTHLRVITVAQDDDMTAGLSHWARVHLNEALDAIQADPVPVFLTGEVEPPKPRVLLPSFHDLNQGLATARALHGARVHDTAFFAPLYAALLAEQPLWASSLPDDEAIEAALALL